MPNEETVELTEKFLFEVNRCSSSIQTLMDYLAAGRLTIGGLRQRALKAIADAARRQDKRLQAVLACAVTGKAAFKSRIFASMV